MKGVDDLLDPFLELARREPGQPEVIQGKSFRFAFAFDRKLRRFVGYFVSPRHGVDGDVFLSGNLLELALKPRAFGSQRLIRHGSRLPLPITDAVYTYLVITFREPGSNRGVMHGVLIPA